MLTALGHNPTIYAIGFLLIIGFDKMFNVFIRTVRKNIIPQHDLGKTSGVIVMLNNISQPLAGLMVAMLSGAFLTETTILFAMGIAGLVFAVCLFRHLNQN